MIGVCHKLFALGACAAVHAFAPPRPHATLRRVALPVATADVAVGEAPTAAAWREACDASGVTSFADFGIKLAAAGAPTAAAPAGPPTAAAWRAACDASGVTSFADFGIKLAAAGVVSKAPAGPPTAAAWREACDASGVTSFADFGIKLAAAGVVSKAPAAAWREACDAGRGVAPAGAWRAACDASGVTSFADFGIKLAAAGVVSKAPAKAALAPTEHDVPAVIVGSGRIGSMLKSDGDAVMTSSSGWPADAPDSGPIYVCTRNDALASVVAAVPEDRRADLCFLQNGMLGPFLEGQGLGDATQVLVYLAVAKLGETPTDGVTDANPEGLTAAAGKWADAFASRLALKELTVGDVERKHAAEFDALAAELLDAGAEALGVAVPAGAPERLKAYARTVAHFPTAVKEFEWRNGWFYKITNDAVAAGKEDPMPLHTQKLYDLELPLPVAWMAR
ncbi:hypothetical protein JL721_571 [Aureococcus anophagefferens]|nr:hypothetical protein JL721_571 [Aureococcus anophagefferens]